MWLVRTSDSPLHKTSALTFVVCDSSHTDISTDHGPRTTDPQMPPTTMIFQADALDRALGDMIFGAAPLASPATEIKVHDAVGATVVTLVREHLLQGFRQTRLRAHKGAWALRLGAYFLAAFTKGVGARFISTSPAGVYLLRHLHIRWRHAWFAIHHPGYACPTRS
jgi:hypothetical protein